MFFLTLVKRGHSLSSVTNGTEAIDKVKIGVYDHIFVDADMPGLDGIETLAAIKAIDPDPIIVLMVEAPVRGLMTRALKLSPFVLLDKPIHVPEILKITEG